MLLFRAIAQLRSHLTNVRYNRAIALVPTMGALHLGHLSLIKHAIANNDVVVVSIFLNPLQFSDHEDLGKYPQQLEVDCRLCEQLGVAIVFAPSVAEMGIESQVATTTAVIPPASMNSVLCGNFRPGHFQGVATIVTKLFNIIQPDRAYFGAKDAQQVAIIRRVVKDLNISVQIEACPTIREASGLAYSSRNQYLSPTEKEQSLVIYRSLQKAQNAFDRGENNSATLLKIVQQELASVPEVKIQYVELVHPDTLVPLEKIDRAGLLAIAAYVGSTRLIDNLILKVPRQPIIAIDGPAGAGKSTVTRLVGEALGLIYLDTGAMYRAVTWLVIESGIAIEDEQAIADLVKSAKIELIASKSSDHSIIAKINDRDVTEAIRTPEVSANVSAIAAQESVRRELVKQQQRWGEWGGIIAEGRDIGTNVFADAELKIFLTASVEERAKRRWQDLQQRGHQAIDLDKLQQEIQLRDEKDSNREIAPLTKANDAIELNTDGLSIEQVTQKIIDLWHQFLEQT